MDDGVVDGGILCMLFLIFICVGYALYISGKHTASDNIAQQCIRYNKTYINDKPYTCTRLTTQQK